MRYEVYAIRTTARGSSYAVYDHLANEPVWVREDRRPVTTRDRRKAQDLAYALAREPYEPAELASALIGCGETQSRAWHYAQTQVSHA